jgi:hypothetical protein
MSFHLSAVSFELEDGHILKAVLHDSDGEEQESELDLNAYIGNNDGKLPLTFTDTLILHAIMI